MLDLMIAHAQSIGYQPFFVRGPLQRPSTPVASCRSIKT